MAASYRALCYSLFSILVFPFSLFYSRAYLYGDQVFYRRLYESLSSADISEIWELQLIYTGSSEPVFGLVAWTGAQILDDKDVFFSIINTLFGVFLLRLLLKYSASLLFIVLMFTNYYVFVLFGPAERLKVAFTFLLVAAAGERFSGKLLFVGIASFAHFQSLILIAARFFGYLAAFRFSRFVRLKSLFLGFFGLLIASAVIFFLVTSFQSALTEKAEAYSKERGIESLRELAILAIAGLIVLKQRRKEATLSLVSLFAAAILLGPERVNMIGFVLFTYFVILERRTHHPVVTALMLYFSVKGIAFVADVFDRGTGF